MSRFSELPLAVIAYIGEGGANDERRPFRGRAVNDEAVLPHNGPGVCMGV